MESDKWWIVAIVVNIIFLIGVSRQKLSKYETGESLPDIDKCSAIAKVFGTTSY